MTATCSHAAQRAFSTPRGAPGLLPWASVPAGEGSFPAWGFQYIHGARRLVDNSVALSTAQVLSESGLEVVVFCCWSQ